MIAIGQQSTDSNKARRTEPAGPQVPSYRPAWACARCGATAQTDVGVRPWPHLDQPRVSDFATMRRAALPRRQVKGRQAPQRAPRPGQLPAKVPNKGHQAIQLAECRTRQFRGEPVPKGAPAQPGRLPARVPNKKGPSWYSLPR